MAAMASKFNFECVIQYYTDQWSLAASTQSEILQLVIDFTVISTRFLPREGRFVVETGKFPKNILSLAKSK